MLLCKARLPVAIVLLFSYVLPALSTPHASPVSLNALHSTYDFVIIGGGASGLTVADRLTEDPSTTVLVLEYGPFDTHEPSVVVPGLLNLTSTPYWFNLTSTPQRHLNNRTFPVTIAAAVGGGTVINGMFFHRGAKADYDTWVKLGATGWGLSDLLPYFRKSETFTPPDASFAHEWDIEWDQSVHGTTGPLQISYPPYQFPVVQEYFRAFHELGIQTPRDPSDGSATGVFWVPSTLDPVSRTRSYARTAHFDRVAGQRPNYHVLAMAAATRIVFDGKRVVAVEYVKRDGNTNETLRVGASKEVVLAAGAVHTPQLLMLSGVGDREELTRHGIECVADVPGVGHNFQDHPTMFFVNQFKKNPEPNVEDLTTNRTFIDEQLDLYNRSREGAYTIVNNGGNTAAFIPLPQFVSPSTLAMLLSQPHNDTMNPSLPPAIQSLYTRQHALQLSNLATNTTAVQETAFNNAFLPLTLLHPLSRGRIALTTRTPLSPPAVNYATLSHPFDATLFAHILRFNRRLLKYPSLLATELVPGSNMTSDQAILDVLPGLVQPTFQHPCCTASMGARDHGGVVDPGSLLVWGVDGVSVVDASVMPVIVGAHLMGTVYGVAEKAADMIKERHGIPC